MSRMRLLPVPAAFRWKRQPFEKIKESRYGLLSYGLLTETSLKRHQFGDIPSTSGGAACEAPEGKTLLLLAHHLSNFAYGTKVPA